MAMTSMNASGLSGNNPKKTNNVGLLVNSDNNCLKFMSGGNNRYKCI